MYIICICWACFSGSDSSSDFIPVCVVLRLCVVMWWQDAECASEALERFQDMTLSSSSSNRNTGLIVYFAQAFNAEVSWHHKYGNSEVGI